MKMPYETESEYKARIERIAARDNTTVEEATYMLLLLELAKFSGAKRDGRAHALGYRKATKAERAAGASDYVKLG